MLSDNASSEQVEVVVTRDLGKAKDAYKSRSTEASRLAHGGSSEGGMSDGLIAHATEHHSKSGEFVKSIVLGGLDGIVTTFAVVSGATGGNLSTGVILVLGFSNIFADALSMGVGDALSTKAENEYILQEKKREQWEFENYPEGEVKEMVEIFEAKGMSKEDAEFVMARCAKYPDLFIDMMMQMELELQVPGEDDNPWKDGFVTFCSFVFFGTFPLLAYVIFDTDSKTSTELFTISCIIAAVMCFILGVLKTKFSVQKWYMGGLEILLMGSATASVAYFIGWLVEDVFLNGVDHAGRL